MTTFQVPQFIEERAKIIGFLTLPQFLYLAAAGAVSFIAFYVFTFFLWLFITVIVVAIGLALAFVKVNGQELPRVALWLFQHLISPHLYTWQRPPTATSAGAAELEELQAMRTHMSIQEKVKALALTITAKRQTPGERKVRARGQYQVVSFATGERKVAKRVDY